MGNSEVLPFKECPSFDTCSAPKCPLDPDIELRTDRLSGEEKCKAHKPTRMKIGAKYPDLLPYGGLTGREFKGKMAWEGKSEDEKRAVKERFEKTREGWGKE
jgi:hypothetical protein